MEKVETVAPKLLLVKVGNIIEKNNDCHPMKTILLLALCALASSCYADSTIFKCKVNGKTIYSESPCGYNTTKRMDIDTSERMGNETFDRDTIDAARARVRADMDKRGKGVSTGNVMPIGAGAAARNASPEHREAECRNIFNELKNIDAWARQPNYSSDWLNQRKVEIQRASYDWGC
jgi:hypothetical protein